MNDIYFSIFTWLPINDIYNCMQTNKNFNNIISKEQFWKYIYQINFNTNPIRINYYNSCKVYHTLKCLMNKMNDKPNSIDIQTFFNLKEIYLHQNNLSYIPNAISLLTQLKLLSLYENNITVIPNLVLTSTNLKYLYLANNKITHIPTNI